MASNAGLGYNLILGAQKAIENPNSNPFNNMPYKENGTGVENIKTARKKFAPKADDPTVAGADGNQSLPDAQNQVDPQKLSSILKNMLQQLAKAAATSGATSPPAIQNTVTDALTGALAALAKIYGFDNIVNILINTFSNNQYYELEPSYNQVVIDAIVSLVQNVIQYGVNNLPYNVVPQIITPSPTGAIPSPLVASVPDLYLQVYYIISANPFPGYVTWEGPNGDFVYTISDSSTPPYPSADVANLTQTQQLIVSLLAPYFQTGILTVPQLNSVLDQAFATTQNNGLNNSLGQNSNNNMMQMLQQLLGTLGGIIQNTQNNHIPKSVLNQPSVNASLKKFANNMSIIKKMKDDTKGAFDLQSVLGQLTQMSSGGSGSGSGDSPLSMSNSGGLSLSSISSLLNSGMSSSSVSSLNTIVTNNPSLTANNVTTIASITSTLQQANVAQNEIILIQTLLSEVINGSNA